MEYTDISIIEQYYIKVSKFIMFICMIAVIIGCVTCTTLNFYEYALGVPTMRMLLADVFLGFPEVIALLKKSREVVVDGRLNKKVFKQVKGIVFFVLFANYYMFTLIQQTKELWYLAFFMAMLGALFLDVKYSIVVNTGLVISIVIICVVQPIEMPEKNMFIQEVILRSIMVMLIMTTLSTIVYFAGKILLNLKEEKEQFVLEYLKAVEKNQEEVREIKHNLNNKIIVLQSIIDRNDIKEASEYINKMIDNTKKLNEKMYCENIILNAILNSKINSTKNYNIQWNINVNVSNHIEIQDDDLGVIMGNLLDNAIEANLFVEAGKRKIDVNIYNKNNSVVINIKNTKNKKRCEEITWKTDKKNHGIGLNSVKRLINKYNGAIGNEDKGDFYEVNIIIWQ